MDSFDQDRRRSEGFQEDALEDVLTLERRAQSIVRDAEAEARRILEAAQEQAEEMRRAGGVALQEETERMQREAAEETQNEIAEILRRAEEEAEGWLEVARQHYGEALRFALDVILLGEDE